MTTSNKPGPSATSPAGDPDSSDKKKSAKVGDLVQIGDNYALVVGLESADHVDDKGHKTTEDHPVVVDLGPARRVESDLSVVE